MTNISRTFTWFYEYFFPGHTASILDFSFSSNGASLVTSSDDGTCRVYDLKMNKD